MKVLVTGADGFIGKNLCMSLMQNPFIGNISFVNEINVSEFWMLQA